jgi:voltage-gated potassium channel
MDQQPNVTPRNAGMTSLWLFVSLLLSLLILPLLEGLYAGRALLLMGLSTTFIVGAIAARSRVRSITFVLLVVALPTAWATLFVDSKLLFVAHCALGSTFFCLVGGVALLVAVRTRVVTFDSVLGAICAYLLFGLAWALSYWAIHTVRPDAFSLPNAPALAEGAKPQRVADFSQFIYFSFVTMSTVGYGDITPLGRVTRAFAWIQSVTGQFYVAVVIAWLVSALPRPGNDTR